MCSPLVRCFMIALLLVAPITVRPMTYVAGSLTNGTELASPNDLTKVCDTKNYTSSGGFLQGSASSSSRWSFVVDLESTQLVSSVAIYGLISYYAVVAGPGGVVKIEAATAQAGPFTEIASQDFGGDRATNPWTGGKGRRIICTPTNARYLRFSGAWTNTFDNQIRISHIQLNPRIVVYDHRPLNNPSFALPNPANVPKIPVFNSGSNPGDSRVSIDMVDGITTATGVIYESTVTSVSLTLDCLRPASQAMTKLIVWARPPDTSLLPKTGEVYVFPGDNPAASPTLLQTFDVVQTSNLVSIPLAAPLHQRYIMLRLLNNQVNAPGAFRIGEVDYSTADPVDVTTLGVIPNDNSDDAPAIRRAMAYSVLYFPPGIYNIGSTLYLPSGIALHGAGKNETTFKMTTDDDAIRIEGQHDIVLHNFGIDYSNFDNSMNEAIFAYNGRSAPFDLTRRVQIDHLKIVNRRSRTPVISFLHTTDCSVRHCEIVNSMRLIWEAPQPVTVNDPPMAWQCYGSHITFGYSDRILVEHNWLYETDEHIQVMNNPPPPFYNRFFQATSIQIVACTNAVTQFNLIHYAGQGTDTNQSAEMLLRGNIIDNCHAGIKLAHESIQQRITYNYIRKFGLWGIPLPPGDPSINEDGTAFCLADNNTFVGGGKGIGEGFWNRTGTADYPSCIFIENSNNASIGASHDLTLRHNRSFDNDRLTTRPSAIGKLVVIRAGTGVAYNVTQSDNLLLSDPAPEPPALPVPRPIALPLSLMGAASDTTDTLAHATDGSMKTAAVFSRGYAPADTRWSFVIDVNSTTRTIHSLALYGALNYRADEAAPGGLIQVEAANSILGPFTLVGSRDFGKDPATNPFTGGKGKRIVLSPTTARYLRISGGAWQNSFTDKVVISEIALDPPLVLDNTSPVHNPNVALPNPGNHPQQSVWSIGDIYTRERSGMDAIDGIIDTGINPLRHVTLTLDVAPGANQLARVVQSLVLQPMDGDSTRLPKIGVLRASSTESPANMDVVLNSFNITAQNGIVTIPTNSTQPRRYLQLDIQTLQDGGTDNARLMVGEITVNATDANAVRHMELYE